MEWDGWALKPGLTHLSQVHTPAPSVVLCVLYQSLIIHLLIDPFLAYWFYVFNVVLFCIFVLYDYNHCFNGSPCHTFSCLTVLYGFTIVIHMCSLTTKWLPKCLYFFMSFIVKQFYIISTTSYKRALPNKSIALRDCCYFCAWLGGLLATKYIGQRKSFNHKTFGGGGAFYKTFHNGKHKKSRSVKISQGVDRLLNFPGWERRGHFSTKQFVRHGSKHFGTE